MKNKLEKCSIQAIKNELQKYLHGKMKSNCEKKILKTLILLLTGTIKLLQYLMQRFIKSGPHWFRLLILLKLTLIGLSCPTYVKWWRL